MERKGYEYLKHTTIQTLTRKQVEGWRLSYHKYENLATDGSTRMENIGSPVKLYLGTETRKKIRVAVSF